MTKLGAITSVPRSAAEAARTRRIGTRRLAAATPMPCPTTRSMVRRVIGRPSVPCAGPPRDCWLTLIPPPVCAALRAFADWIEVNRPHGMVGDALDVRPVGVWDGWLEQRRKRADLPQRPVELLQQCHPLVRLHLRLCLVRQRGQLLGRRGRRWKPARPLPHHATGGPDEEVAGIRVVGGPPPHADLVLSIPVLLERGDDRQ